MEGIELTNKVVGTDCIGIVDVNITTKALRLRQYASSLFHQIDNKNVQSFAMNEFAKWPTSFQRLCSKQRKIIVFLTEINNKT